MAQPTSDIPKGSLVLVTGANGFVGAHICKRFLEFGYRVRGTVRDIERCRWLLDDVFQPYAAKGFFELVTVEDLALPGAFDDAIARPDAQGNRVAVVVHVAIINSYSPDPNQVLPPTLAGINGILEAALRAPAVRSFVYTSSIVTSVMHPYHGKKVHVERDTWNEEALRLAWAPPPYEMDRFPATYSASKVVAEQAVWKFKAERQPHFRVNAVCPSAIFGEPLHKSHAETANARIAQLYRGDTSLLHHMPAFISVNMRDVALLHVAAALDPTVDNARIQAWAQPFNWNDILAILRKLYPNRTFVDDLPGLPDKSEVQLTTDVSEALALLKKWGGQDGWISLEETVADSVRPLDKWYESKE
ncbi:hypothetical protein VTK73DRAFT_7715 [Phialemonium thermophilum]|uniref:3-beta hydroxysteroid dehydrogenase/isomerase domain-containing protein n=1 Tax=Phialemonium thermophilum TaxID=223376 RepID=A0ABR3WDA3_9PEZI